VPLLALLLFTGLASHQLQLPGLNYDEAFDVLPAMQLLLGQQVETLRSSGLRVGGLTLPVMVMDYKGVVHTYWALPFLWALGSNVFALRVSCLFVSLLVLAATHRFARTAFGAWAAGAAVVLLATNPSFVFWSRQGVLWTTGMVACGMGALAALADYVQNKLRIDLWLATFLLGLGLSAKLAFFWFPVALGVVGAAVGAWTLLRRRRRRAGKVARKEAKWRPAVLLCGVAGLTFLAGLAPVIVYNVQTQGTLDRIRASLETSYFGVDNLAWLSNLSLRWDHLQALLGSTGFWYLGGVYGDALFLRAFWLSAIVLVGSCAWSVHKARRVRPGGSDGGLVPRGSLSALAPLFPLLMVALMFLQSGVTVSSLEPEHYLLLLPFPQLVVALAIALLSRVAGTSRLASVLAGAALVLLVCSQLAVVIDYHVALAETGGVGAHSEANYALADYLAAEGRPVVAMDWGIKMQTQFLTAGRVYVAECFGYERGEAWRETVRSCTEPYLGNPITHYVFHPAQGTVFGGRMEALRELAGEQGLNLVVRREITDRRGEVVFLVLVTAQPGSVSRLEGGH
jgi:hypothetical protein